MRKMFDGVLARPASIRSTLPRVLDDIIMRMLAIDPAHRYPSCGEAARALHSFLMSACDGREATSIVQEFLTKLFDKEAERRKEEALRFNF